MFLALINAILGDDGRHGLNAFPVDGIVLRRTDGQLRQVYGEEGAHPKERIILLPPVVVAFRALRQQQSDPGTRSISQAYSPLPSNGCRRERR